MEESKIDTPKIEKASFSFSQEGNCVGSTEEYEELTIECDSSAGIVRDNGAFYVLKTETGWSVNDETELKYLFDKIDKALQLFIQK